MLKIVFCDIKWHVKQDLLLTRRFDSNQNKDKPPKCAKLLC